jgi:hypothetical protein
VVRAILRRVDVEPVDPRDAEGEDHDPAYRVYFWESTAPPGAADAESFMMAATEHRLVGAENVQEVVAWADGHVRPDQAYELFVEVIRASSVRLVRLSGLGPADLDERRRWRPSGAA